MRVAVSLFLLASVVASRAAPHNAGVNSIAISVRELPAAGTAVLADASERGDLACVAFLDGSALLASVSAHGPDATPSIFRLRDGAWESAGSLPRHDSDARVTDIAMTADGRRVAAVWLEHSKAEGRVIASFSPDAGGRWLAPVELGSSPAGMPALVLLSDGAFVAAWTDSEGSLWLRRVSPEYTVQPPVRLATRPAALKNTRPFLTLTRDYAGGRSSAELLVAYTETDGVHGLLVNIPEGNLLVSERACDCAPTPEQLRGIPIRGRVESVDPGTNRATIAHGQVPGVFETGTHAFDVAPLDLGLLHTGGALMGRFERGPAGWRLFDIQMLGEPAPSRGGK